MLKHWVAKVVFLTAKLLIRMSIFPNLFKEFVAAYSIGEGTQAYNENRYKDALKILKPVADYQIADPYVGRAQYIVGLLYLHGLGTTRNTVYAEHYFTEAARRGNDEAKKYILKTKGGNS